MRRGRPRLMYHPGLKMLCWPKGSSSSSYRTKVSWAWAYLGTVWFPRQTPKFSKPNYHLKVPLPNNSRSLNNRLSFRKHTAHFSHNNLPFNNSNYWAISYSKAQQRVL
jgi:hypothetical protein